MQVKAILEVQGLKAPVSNKLKCKRKKKVPKNRYKQKRRKTSNGPASTRPQTETNKEVDVKQERGKRKRSFEITLYTITCDKCGNDCSFKSFFILKTNEDFCEKCYVSMEKSWHGNQQKNGIAIE